MTTRTARGDRDRAVPAGIASARSGGPGIEVTVTPAPLWGLGDGESRQTAGNRSALTAEQKQDVCARSDLYLSGTK